VKLRCPNCRSIHTLDGDTIQCDCGRTLRAPRPCLVPGCTRPAWHDDGHNGPNAARANRMTDFMAEFMEPR
jgi:hypothetical protein